MFSKKDKRVEEEDILEETMDTKSKKKSKKSKRSKKSKQRDNNEDEFDSAEEEQEILPTKKTKSKKSKKKNQSEDTIYDDSMLEDEGTETKSKSKSKKKSSKKNKSTSRATISEKDNEYYDDNRNQVDTKSSDRDDDRNYSDEDGDDYDDDDTNRTSSKHRKGKKKKKKKRNNNNNYQDENKVLTDEEWTDQDDRNSQSSDGFSGDEDYDDYDNNGSSSRHGNRNRRRNRGNRDDNDLLVSDAEILVSGETPRDDSPEMRLLNRFRLQLRQVGAHSDSKGFISALHNHFVGVGRDKFNQIKQGEFRDRLKEILRDTEISHYDISRLMDILDSDGNGVIDWDEFVSFLSFPSKEMKKLVISLRKKMLREAGNKGGSNNFET